MNIFKSQQEFYYETDTAKLVQDNCITILSNIKSKSIDMIFADPPYFLSSGGITCHSGKMVSVDKGLWDKKITIQEKHNFNKKWIRKCKRILKDDGSIWISGTMHNIYSIGMALEEEGFKIINNITWMKTNPPPNISCRAFTHSTETILWAKKDIKNAKHKFNYDIMKIENNGKQMKDVWTSSLTKPSEKIYGKHPTQKPLFLLKRILSSCTNELDIILDPFSGSGTTGVAALKLNRKYIGIELDKNFIEYSKLRLTNIKSNNMNE